MLAQAAVLSPAEAREAYVAARRRLYGGVTHTPLPIPAFLPSKTKGTPPRRKRQGGLSELMPPRLKMLLHAASAHYAIPVDVLTGRDRHHRVPRSVVMLIAHEHLGYSLDRIGAHFGGRSANAVMGAVKIRLGSLTDLPTLELDIELLRSQVP